MLKLIINDRIRNRTVQYFNRFRINLRFDAVASAFAFEATFDPNNIEHKEMFCVGHYHIVKLEYNGQRLLTGYITNNGFATSGKSELVTFGGYSLPGVLEDCQISPENYPLQKDGMTLEEIARELIRPFGLQMIIDPAVARDMNSVYEKATAEPGQSIKDFLTVLATQKNILITHTENGALWFTKAKTNQLPILEFDTTKEQTIPFTNMQLGFNGQMMHSHIYVVKQADEEGGNAGESLIRNPFVPFVYRSRVITQTSGDDIDTEKAAMNALAEELKSLQLNITTDRWDYGTGLIKPNKTITVRNPEIYLYNKTKWFIEEVEYQGDEKKMITTMKCCIPEVYNGGIPEYLWKGINLH